MARSISIKKINKEDFDKQYQPLIDKIAFPLNSFMEQVKSAFDKNINFSNLNQEIITLTITVDADGIPIIPTQWKSTLRTKVLGSVCIKATNQDSPASFPISQPFINFVQNGALVFINQISGLQADNKYQLIVLSIGS